jgi:transposase InsO family protein
VNNEELVFRLRKRIFDEWKYKRLTWQEVKEKYGFSKKWFYKWLGRFLEYGQEGLRNKVQKRPPHPSSLGWEAKLKILDYVYESPTHGPDRIAMESGLGVSAKTIWKYLVSEGLNSRRKRRLWAHYQGKPVLTEKEKLVMEARKRHIEAKGPGELIGIDTFSVCVKGLGKLCQYTACDCYSSYGWALVYTEKTSDNAVDFFVNHMLRNLASFKIKRVITDQGVEFYSARWKNNYSYFRRILERCNVKHTVIKKGRPWTNGYVERLNQTIWQEFYLCRLPRPYTSVEMLNGDLQKFMREYNFKRMHSGYKLKEGGFQFPGHAFFDVRESSNIIEIKY